MCFMAEETRGEEELRQQGMIKQNILAIRNQMHFANQRKQLTRGTKHALKSDSNVSNYL